MGATADFFNEREESTSVAAALRFDAEDVSILRSIAIVANLSQTTETATAVSPIFEQWEAVVTVTNEAAPPGLDRAFHASTKWIDMRTEEVLLRSALTGVGVSLAVAFVVMLVGTRSLVAATLATVTIVASVVSVVACMALYGYDAGIVETVVIALAVGFSVDYPLHVAIAFVDSRAKSRQAKLQGALREMGVSILGAALTTLLAAAILFGTEVVFFFRFGVLLTTIVGASLVLTLTLFAALLFTCGPVGANEAEQ